MLRTRFAVLLLLLCSPASRPAQAEPRADEPSGMDTWLTSHLGGLVELYKHFHSHPELSYQEVETSAKVAEELKKAGAEVTSGVGKLGVVGVIANGPGPVVLVRTDMDALPVR